MGKLHSIYLRFPAKMKDYLISIYGYSLRRNRYGKNYIKFYERDKNNMKLPLNQLVEIQLEKMKELLLECYDYSIYYRRIFEQHGIAKEDILHADSVEEILERLPILEKKMLRENLKQIESVNEKRKGISVTYTSGSTGTPMAITQDREASEYTFSLGRRFYDWMGLNKSFKSVRFSGRIIVPPGQKKAPFWVYNSSIKQLFMSTYHLKDENIPAYIRKLNQFSPELIDGYPSAIVTLANYILTNNIELAFKPLAIATTAETLTEDMQKKIETAFKCKVYNQYASSEGAPMICQCKEGNMHLWIDTGVFEFVNKKSLSEELEQAEMVVTSFRSKKTPLIRYNIGDTAVLYKNERKCPCGCEYPIIHSILGRTDDILYTKEKGYVGRLDTAFKGLVGIQESQIIQKSIDKIVVYIVKDENYTDAIEKQLRENLAERLGYSIEYEFRYVEQISRGPNGKFRSVIRECNIEDS